MNTRLQTFFDDVERDKDFRAWITARTPEAVPKDTGTAPLSGLLFGVKDNIDVQGFPTTAGCPSYSYKPEHSAPVVSRLEAAGALCMGKTNLDQFATGLVGTRSPYGVCRNAFQPDYISGGSSAGSAVAVARGHVDFALGTDTAGSGRVPAAFNRLIGLKPTRGLVSTRGVVPACASLDCVSLFTRDLPMARNVFQVMRHFDPECIWSRPDAPRPFFGGPWRVGHVDPDQLFFDGDPSARTAHEDALEKWRSLGHTLIPVDPAPLFEAAKLLYDGPWVNERVLAVGEFLRTAPPDADPIVAKIIREGERGTAAQVFEAQYKLQACQQAARTLWEQIDFLCLPTAPTCYPIQAVQENPLILNSRLGTYTNFVNLLDLCALALPHGAHSSGVPAGFTLMAPAFSDDLLLAAGDNFLNHQPAKAQGMLELAVLGAHLEGQPLHKELLALGARLHRRTRTAPHYRFYLLPGGPPHKPGMIRVPENGTAIEVETYLMPPDAFGNFVANIPHPLGIGTLELDDGTWVKGFLCEPVGVTHAQDISNFGGWRTFLAKKT